MTSPPSTAVPPRRAQDGIHRSPTEAGTRRLGARIFAGGLVVACGFVLTCGVGCNEADEAAIASPMEDGVAGISTEESQGIPSLTLSDLPEEMNLTDDQRARLGDALDRFARAREERVRERADRRRERSEGHGLPGGVPRRHGRLERRPGFPAGPREFGHAPVVRLLEQAGEILDTRQFVLLAGTMANAGISTPLWQPSLLDGAAMRAHGFGPLLRGGLREMADDLELTRTQREDLRGAMKRSAESLRAALDTWRDGTGSPESVRDAARASREAMVSEARRILSPEQFARVDDVRRERTAEHVERRIEQLSEAMERRAEVIGRVLNANDGERSAIGQTFSETVAGRELLLRGLADGSRAPEDVAYELHALERATADRIRAGLGNDAQARYDALLRMPPRSDHRAKSGR